MSGRYWGCEMRSVRIRVLAAPASFVFLALVAPAFAQDGTGLPTTGLGIALFAGGILLGVAIMVLTQVAPRTRNTYDDQALEFLKQAKPILEKWLDPNDPAVPPSPSNQSGTAS